MTEQPPELMPPEEEDPGEELAGVIAGRQAQQGRATVFDLVQSMAAEFDKALPKHMPLETFMRVAVTEIRQNPDLQACTSTSLLGALMTAARLGLEVGGPLGHFYLTPRNVKNRATGQHEKQVVPIVGYKGLRELATRAGVGAVKAWVVYEGDTFAEGANSERGPYFEFRKAPGPVKGRAEVGVIAVGRLPGGDVQHVYLTIDEVMERKARGAAGSSGPWGTDREAMIRKTALRALASELPQSTALAVATKADEQVQTFNPGTGELTA
jgi:recombination protein RecT